MVQLLKLFHTKQPRKPYIFIYRPYYDEKNSALIQSIYTAFVQVSACAKIDKHISVFVCSRCFENVKNP